MRSGELPRCSLGGAVQVQAAVPRYHAVTEGGPIPAQLPSGTDFIVIVS